MNEGWVTHKIGSLGTVITGKTPSTQEEGNFNGKYPFITIPDLDGRLYIDFTERSLSDQGASRVKGSLLPKNAVMMSCIATVGKCGITTRPSFTNQQINSVICNEKVEPRFLYYVFTQLGHELEAAGGGGSVYTNVSKSRFSDIEVILPPLPEQRAIAGVLSALDDKIELNRRMNQTLEQLAQAIYKHMFIDNPEREKWEEKTIGEVVTIVGGSTPSTARIDYWEGGSTHWATPKDLASLQSPILLDTNSTITELGLKQISSGLLPVGTVLLSSRAPIGYMVITQIPVAINQGFIGIKCTEDMPNYYILNWLKVNLEEIIGRANGTTFLEISKTNFRPMLIKIPPTVLKNQFVSVVEPLYKKMTSNLIESSTLADLRDTLLPKLMSGQVRVNQSVIASALGHEAIPNDLKGTTP